MITLHALAPSHPCMTAEAALRLKGVDYERVDLPIGPHAEQMAAIYGAGNTTVPGALFDGEPVHTSRAILARLDALAPDPPLYPTDAVREAERWGDVELQDLGRRLPFGALHFRPEAMGTFGGGDPLDPAGTDFAMRYLRGTWKYHGITCERLAADLAGLPEKIAHVEGLLADGVLGGEAPNAADLQIAATLRVLLLVGDLRPLLGGVEGYARERFPDYAGDIPAGAFPAGWLP
jgi:glutathione S-transferase